MCYFCFMRLVCDLTSATRSYFHFWFITYFFPNLRVKCDLPAFTGVGFDPRVRKTAMNTREGSMTGFEGAFCPKLSLITAEAALLPAVAENGAFRDCAEISHFTALCRARMRRHLQTNTSKQGTRNRRKMLHCRWIRSHLCLQKHYC